MKPFFFFLPLRHAPCLVFYTPTRTRVETLSISRVQSEQPQTVCDLFLKLQREDIDTPSSPLQLHPHPAKITANKNSAYVIEKYISSCPHPTF